MRKIVTAICAAAMLVSGCGEASPTPTPTGTATPVDCQANPQDKRCIGYEQPVEE